jgi:hypothetical protein
MLYSMQLLALRHTPRRSVSAEVGVAHHSNSPTSPATKGRPPVRGRCHWPLGTSFWKCSPWVSMVWPAETEKSGSVRTELPGSRDQSESTCAGCLGFTYVFICAIAHTSN